MTKKQELLASHIIKNNFQGIVDEFTSYVGILRIIKNISPVLDKAGIELMIDFGRAYILIDCVKNSRYKVCIQRNKELSVLDKRQYPIVYRNDSFMICVPEGGIEINQEVINQEELNQNMLSRMIHLL